MHTTCICVENNHFISAMGPWDQSVCMGDRKVSVSYVVKVYYKVGKRDIVSMKVVNMHLILYRFLHMECFPHKRNSRVYYDNFLV